MVQTKALTKPTTTRMRNTYLVPQLFEKIGRAGPNGAPSAPARETRDVSSRVLYKPDNNG